MGAVGSGNCNTLKMLARREANRRVRLKASRRARLKANEAAIVSLRMKNYDKLSDNKQVCIVPNPSIQSAAVLGRSFSITKSGLCVSVLLNTLDISITI